MSDHADSGPENTSDRAGVAGPAPSDDFDASIEDAYSLLLALPPRDLARLALAVRGGSFWSQVLADLIRAALAVRGSRMR